MLDLRSGEIDSGLDYFANGAASPPGNVESSRGIGGKTWRIMTTDQVSIERIEKEVAALRSQIAISNDRVGRGGRRYLPYAFTEHGAIMAATILNTPRATEVSVYVVRAFLRLREIIASNKALAKKLDELEKKVATYDQAIGDLIRAIRQVAVQPEPKRRPIGFVVSEDKSDKNARRR